MSNSKCLILRTIAERVIITGATGLLGRRLLSCFEKPVVLSRAADKTRKDMSAHIVVFPWQAMTELPPAMAFQDCEAVFHLAGEPVASGRWTQAKKEAILNSRIQGTRNLVTALSVLDKKPRVLVSASAVGYYGDRADEVLDEASSPGSDFLANVCQQWEAEALRATDFGIRVVVLRTGIVLSDKGGALARQLPFFRLGLGGTLGIGKQWMPWIHIDDVVGLFLHAAHNDSVCGPMNATAPTPVTNAHFTRVLARVLSRPAFLPVPRIALKLAFGEFASVLFASQRVTPEIALKTGYTFKFPEIETALSQTMTP